MQCAKFGDAPVTVEQNKKQLGANSPNTEEQDVCRRPFKIPIYMYIEAKRTYNPVV